jgi:hypothetical protein
LVLAEDTLKSIPWYFRENPTMAERKWGAITSGATFEALARTIVAFEDSGVCHFDRPGQDGGQDARSSDGTRVFQAKFHNPGSAAAAISDAKREAAKLSKYRAADHPRHDQWRGVTHWRLLTNATFNPRDRATWERDVVPLFEAQGLVADYWGQADLDAALDRHPEIHRSFFENEPRVFLSIAEIRESLPDEEPFLRRGRLGRFRGRDEELNRVQQFLDSNKLFLVIHGAAGVGKTRLLLESGERAAAVGRWQVLWANVASLTANGSWFDSVVPERPTLLLIDEPPDETVLRQVAEQLGGRGRAANWKIAIAVRSQKDPVLRFLRGARIRPRIEELLVEPLSPTDAETLCLSLLQEGLESQQNRGDLRDMARELSRRGFGRYPVWLTLAVHLLEERGDLRKVPESAKGLANEYLSEILNSDATHTTELLRAVALLRTLNREDNSAIQFVTELAKMASPTEVQVELSSLVKRRVLAKRGVRGRFLELKPDVIRDHVLLTWLSVEVEYGAHSVVPSESARSLLQRVGSSLLTGTKTGFERAILISIARTEFLLGLASYDVPLLRDFFANLRESIATMRASQQITTSDLLASVASMQPDAITLIVAELLHHPADDEDVERVFGKRTISTDDVVRSLGWPLFNAAMGARTEGTKELVLKTLCAVVRKEAALRSPPRNDGRSANTLVKRVLEGGPQFWSEFDDVAEKLGLELLTALAGTPPGPPEMALLECLIEPIMNLERHQTWSDAWTVNIRTIEIGQDHPGWRARASLLSHARQLVSGSRTPTKTRVALWQLLAKAHQELNRIRKIETSEHDRYHESVLEDLVWTTSVLRNSEPSIEELTAARGVWDWHRRFETDPKLKSAAQTLEAIYASDAIAQEFEPLFDDDLSTGWESRLWQKATQLSQVSSPQEIFEFLERARIFLGSDQELNRLTNLAWTLGRLAEGNTVVGNFVELSLQEVSTTPRSDFAIQIAGGWVTSLRNSQLAARAHVLVDDLLIWCGSEAQQARLLIQIYGRLPANILPTPTEIASFRSRSHLFIRTGQTAKFVEALAQTVEHDWPGLRHLLESLLEALPPSDLAEALRGLVEGIYRATRRVEPSDLPTGIGEWLLDRLLPLPDMNDLRSNSAWHIDEILKRVGRVPVVWLPTALRARRQLEANADRLSRSHAVGLGIRVSKFVRPLRSSDADDASVLVAIREILDFADDSTSIRYRLPDICRDIDPLGIVVPALVASRLSTCNTADSTLHLAQVGLSYALGTVGWRHIASEAIAAGNRLGMDLETIFAAISERGTRSWTATVGDVPQIFVSAVADARNALADESDPDLRRFWVWRLSNAESELQEREEWAREERGE